MGVRHICRGPTSWLVMMGLPAGVGQRELAQVRQAELRLRCPGSSRPRAAFPLDQVGGTAEDGRPAARGGRGGEGARGGGPARRVHGDRGADRRGERDDLRGQAAGRNGRAPGARGRKRGLYDALTAEKSAEIGRLAADASRSLGCDAGLEAAEAVIRAGMMSARRPRSSPPIGPAPAPRSSLHRQAHA
jgi:hypothetical protein